MLSPETASHSPDIRTLRARISSQYEHYHRQNARRFPILDYNTNRVNYEPLRDAFEEEFYVVRGLDRTSSTLHIPSTNTLMLLFTDPAYVPGRKILNTCWSFADGPATTGPQPDAQPAYLAPAGRQRTRVVIVLSGVLSLLLLAGAVWWLNRPQPSGLVLYQPTPNSHVPQEVIVKGRVANARTVWIVVRSVTNRRCWVQPAINVQTNGFWLGVIYVGSLDKSDNGYTSELRAFVDPVSQLTVGAVLDDWPEAALSTPAISVIRGPVDK